VTKNVRFFSFFVLIIIQIFFSCNSTAIKNDAPSNSAAARPQSGEETRNPAGGLAEEIRNLTETGLLSSMAYALELIRSRNLGGTEFGRIMNGINASLIRRIYPDSGVRLPSVDLPQTHNYARILREASRGNYSPPPVESTDFLEYVLPFLALFNDIGPERFPAALADLDKAFELRPRSILPPYFRGIALERLGRLAEAEAAYNLVLEISGDCYPALAGLARTTGLSGRKQEAVALFSDLVIRYPDNFWIKRQLAIAHYENRDWQRAQPAIAEILQRDTQDGEIIMMNAHILIELGQYAQAQAALDSFTSINPDNRLYLFLRARVQAEGFRNRDAALNYLRSILRSGSNDEEVSIYTASLLMESQRPSDQAEGRAILANLQNSSDSSLSVLSLSLRDAINLENWREAQGLLNRILASRRNAQDLLDAYTVERGLGNNARALSYARELYERNSTSDENIAVYISALIDTGRRDEASRMIEARLAAVSGGVARSRYYFLRSRIQGNDEAALNDLRSCLFEDPRNLQALIAMFEIYHRRREERRAVYYLKQALAIAPDNPRLKRYEQEYAGRMNP
jgi:tetratricopeptide (TPR) repeat protein